MGYLQRLWATLGVEWAVALGNLDFHVRIFQAVLTLRGKFKHPSMTL